MTQDQIKQNLQALFAQRRILLGQLAEQLYATRQITATGYKIRDTGSLLLLEEEWLWIQERVAEMVLAESHSDKAH